MSDLLREYLALLEYELALLEAEDDLLRFAQVTMPDPRFPDDPNATKYLAAKHHGLMADITMQVERHELRKVILNLPPRHGKTEICTKRAAAWISARNPDKDIIVATYGEKFAHDFAKDVREIMASPRFQQIFPEYHLLTANNEHLKTYMGGDIFFLGRRSRTTGRGGHFILVDDPTKDDREVRYQAFRDDVWEWFTQTLLTRRHNDQVPVMISQTRWHEDDIVGRITDPQNPAYSAKFAEGWRVINLPAIASEDDPLGRKPGEALWPERFGIEYLEEMQAANAVSFAALYQNNPTPEDGVFYSKEELWEYTPDELPTHLRNYVASDHAVATAQINDRTCILPFGVCENDIAWVLPNAVWRRMDGPEAVEEMIQIMKLIRPVFWYGEKGQISKSLGSFLKKRMQEEELHVPIIEDHPAGDKVQRAQSARARCAQGRIRFPKNAPWWPRAKAEILKFPNARFDDFVDAVSIIGMKLQMHGAATVPTRVKTQQEGTFGHLLAEFRRQDAQNTTGRSKGW